MKLRKTRSDKTVQVALLLLHFCNLVHCSSGFVLWNTNTKSTMFGRSLSSIQRNISLPQRHRHRHRCQFSSMFSSCLKNQRWNSVNGLPERGRLNNDNRTRIRTFRTNGMEFGPHAHKLRRATIVRLTSTNSDGEIDRISDELGEVPNIIHKQSDTKDIFLQKIRWSICNDIIPRTEVSNGASDGGGSDGQKSLVMLLGISGGCDSIALFHSILDLLDRPTLNADTSNEEINTQGFEYVLQYGEDNIPTQLHVVHFDHRQRGEDSDGDRMLVEELCKKHHIHFHCFYWGDGNQKEKESKGSAPARFSQEVARDWRRSKSVELIKSIIENNEKDHGVSSKGMIFTAHHKDDSEETMLLKILRGVHITNISGIDPIKVVEVSDPYEHHIYFAKPLLRVRKAEIYEFLINENHRWREDCSNASGKYLRNRVRNELIPLLNDLVGGKDVLELRLENIEEQSRKLRVDVSGRADQYLNSFCKENIVSNFVLPHHNQALSVVEEEALYKWTQKESKGSVNLSYDKLRVLSRQISAYPHRRQWKINIGDGWDVQRDGAVLFLLYKDSPLDTKSCEETNNGIDRQKWNLEVSSNIDFAGGLHPNDSVCVMDVVIEISDLSRDGTPELHLKTVDGNESLKFLPPWRKGKSEMKIKEFLRGQKVPLHRRRFAPIICLSTDVGDRIVAVFVENTIDAKNAMAGRWIINSSFELEDISLKPTKKKKQIIVTKVQ